MADTNIATPDTAPTATTNRAPATAPVPPPPAAATNEPAAPVDNTAAAETRTDGSTDTATSTRAAPSVSAPGPRTTSASRDPVDRWGPPPASLVDDPSRGAFSGELDIASNVATGAAERDSAPFDRTYHRSPDLLAEHALLGSLLQVPDRLYDMEKFLHVRDFSTAETRTLFTTLRHLIHDKMVTSLDSIDSHRDRYPASRLAHLRSELALRNQRVLEEAVRHHWYTDTSAVHAPAAAVRRLVTAAPVDTLHLRGVYDSAAQMGLARDVLAAAIRRRVAGMGVLIARRDPLIPPPTTQGGEPSDAVARVAASQRSNVEFLRADLDRLAARWARATERTGPEAVTGPAATSIAADAAGAAKPRPTGLLAAWRARHAERHLIHLAMHSGHSLDPALQPEHFSIPKYANTWRLLQRLHRRGEDLNYVNVFKDAFIHRTVQPIISDQEILALGHAPPNTAPKRIAASLRTVMTTAIARAGRRVGASVTTAATNRAVPVGGLIDYTGRRLDALTGTTNAAATAHARTTHSNSPERRTR